MAYSQSKELTDTEKRLQALKTQLFGKEQHVAPLTTMPSVTTIAHRQDLTYLKKDLLKIFTLAMIALSVQLILYVQFTFKILKLN